MVSFAGVIEMAEEVFETLRPSIQECMQTSRKLILVGHSLGALLLGCCQSIDREESLSVFPMQFNKFPSMGFMVAYIHLQSPVMVQQCFFPEEANASACHPVPEVLASSATTT